MRDFLSSTTTGAFLSCALVLWGCEAPEDPDECPPDCPDVDAGDADAGGDPPEDGGGPEPDAGGGDSCDPRTIPALAVEDVAPGHTFSAPVFVTQPPGETEDLYVVEQPGTIRIVRDGAVLPTAFLDITADVDFDGERGLLGLAFHPEYQANGRFFVYYTPSDVHHNRVAEYQRRSDDPDRAGPEVAILLSHEDPEDNHDGGMIAFGPDGYLYVGMGDGGGSGDQHGAIGNGQDLDSPFGKLHRLDVEASASGYVAEGNPYAGGGGLATIWAWGLRNPWRFSFDRDTGDLYIGDVGQYEWEEVDIQPASSGGGENYGWAAWEGTHRFEARAPLVPEPEDHVPPVFEYHHDSGTIITGCSITGGYVYRGSAIPELRGFYLLGDFCSGARLAFRWCDGAVVDTQVVEDLASTPAQLTSFGEDQAGELYMTGRGGSVVRIIPG